MEAIVPVIQKTPIPTILIVAGLFFLLLGFVTKLGGFIEVASEQKRLAIPIGLFVLIVGLFLNFIPTRNTPMPDSIPGSPQPTVSSSPTSVVTNAPVDTTSTPADGCFPPYVFRLAVPTDHVCVTEDSRKRVEAENQRAAERREASGVGAYGADTCLTGYVWREAFEGDTVCVQPERRDEVRSENAHAHERITR